MSSVTGILKDNFGEPPHYDPWYASRGKALHHAIFLHNKGTLDTIPEEIKGRFEAYLKFAGQTGFVPKWSELQLYSKKYHFAGTPDMVGSISGSYNLTLVDIKSSLEPKVELQIGGYCLLYEENFRRIISRACAVELKANGNYNIKWIKDIKRAKRVFLATLTISGWQKETR